MAEGLVGQVINGKYRVVGVLGEGGMGVVYKAEQLDVEARVLREVGLKMIRPDLDLDPYLAAKFARDFLGEVRITAQLSSPHVVTVYDCGQTERGQLYFSMEFVRGPTLKEVLQQQSEGLPVQRVVTIVRQICDALAEAHGASDPIVHCDLKPANIFLTNRQGQEWVKIGDFGIAKLLVSLSEAATRIEGRPSPGTPRYMAPEQWRGEDVDGRTDLYALGVMMYEMLTGKPPFSGPTESLRHQHLNKAPPPLPSSVPPALSLLVVQLLAKDLQARPTDVVQIRHVLGSSSQWDEALARVVPTDERTTLLPTDEDRIVGEEVSLQGGNRSKRDLPVTYRKTARRRLMSAILLIGVLVGIGAATYTWPPSFLQHLFALTANLLKRDWPQERQNGVGIIPTNPEKQPPQADRKGGEEPGKVTAETKTGQESKSQSGNEEQANTDPTIQTPPLRLQGYLQVTVNVPTASVKVDGVDRGVAHQNEPLLVYDLAAGIVRVLVKAEGYEPVERSVAIETDQPAQEAFELKPLPPSPVPSNPPHSDDVRVKYWGFDKKGNLIELPPPAPRGQGRDQ